MHWHLVALLIVAVPVGVHAAVLDDAAGDAVVEVADASGPAAPTQVVDLLDLTIVEEGDAFRFIVTHGEDQAMLALVQTTVYWTTFKHGDASYVLALERAVPLDAYVDKAEAWATLFRHDAGGLREIPAPLSPSMGADHITALVPRELLPDAAGALLTPGRSLTDFAVYAFNSPLEGPFVYQPGAFLVNELAPGSIPEAMTRIRDRMPDTGNGTTPFEVSIGADEAAYASLTSPAPFRASNGEATTIVFELDASNLRSEAHRFSLSTHGVPIGWDVWFPQEEVVLAPGDEGRVAAVAHVPFSHAHGARAEFTVRLQSVDDPRTFATAVVGVVYPEIAQPAGHHDTVFFHAVEQHVVRIEPAGAAGHVLPVGWGYMNTAPDDPLDDGVVVADSYLGEEGYGFLVPLSPGLAMGIDIDADRVGELRVPVSSERRDLKQVGLAGRLEVTVPGATPILLADVVPVQRADVGRDAPADVVSAIVPIHSEPVDLLRGMQLRFVLTEEHEADSLDAVMGVALQLHPGGQAVLPLEEYHQDVSQALALDLAVSLHAEEHELPVNAGKPTLFTVHVTNQGDATGRIGLALAGPGASHARLADVALAGMAPGETRPVHVAVTAPPQARVDDIVDVVLQAQSSDADAPSVIRLTARVTEQPIAAVEAPAVDHKTPAPGGLVAVGLAAIMARRVRRR